MKKLLQLTILVLLTLVSGCAPKIRTVLNDAPLPALAPDAQVLVLGTSEADPVGILLVGTVQLGDAGATMNCGLDRMLHEARVQARRAGANVLKLTEVLEPNMASTCYRIKADLLFAKDLSALQARLTRQHEAENKSHLPPGTPYALLYVYRPAQFGGAAMSYDLHLNDSIIYQARYNSRATIRLTKPGAVTLWAQDGHSLVTLQVEPGQEYFLRCGLLAAGFKGRPWLSFVNTRQGRLEYERTGDWP